MHMKKLKIIDLFCGSGGFTLGYQVSEADHDTKTSGQDSHAWGITYAVNDDFSIKNSNSIYVIGDAANYKNKNGEPLPGIAPVAIQQGKYLAKLLTTNQSSNIKKNFRYRDKGMMATIGGFKAIGVIGKIQVSGLLAWLTWSLVHLVYLIGYKSKFIVLIEWVFAYFLNRRGTRIIYRENIKNNTNN